MSKKHAKKHAGEEPGNVARKAGSGSPGPDAGADGAPSPDAGGPAAARPSAEDERLRELERELDAARAEAAAAADRALRTLAEFDNFRRRTERERDESARRGRADVLRELLEVCDNFDRALEHADDGVPEAFLEGMRLVARGLHDLLDRKGVARIDADGQPFDPECHEALGAIPTDGHEPNTVIQVVQAGYMLEERVLRPAKVLVAAAMPSPAEPARDGGGTGPETDDA